MILEQFDFSRVQRTMLALNWGWLGGDAPPSMDDIERQADYVMQTVISGYKPGDPFYSISCGGFCALILKYDAGPRLELSFAAERRCGD
jgi:hypothetical protein